MSDPNRAFKGVWINAELWTNTELSHTEKFLIAEIDSLTSEDHPCYASNKRLAEVIQVSVSRVNDLLCSLQKRGYLICTDFDGKTSYRVVTPLLSSNPATAKEWIGKKKKFRLPENRKAPTETSQKQESSEGDFLKTGKQPSQKQESSLPENRKQRIPIENTNRDKTPPNPAPAPARARRAKLAADVGLVQIPLFLQGDDFRKSLQDWIDHRIMLRIPMTQRALEEVIKTCEQWDKPTAILNIYYSIKKGWKDVYAPRKESRPPKDRDDPRSCL
jgi:Helix-turn-helix domain